MQEIHPSHEAYTGKPYLEIGQRVSCNGLEGQIEEIRSAGSKQNSVFEYLVKYDNEKANKKRGWVRSSDLHKIEGLL